MVVIHWNFDTMKVTLQESFICGSVRFHNEVSDCNGDRIKAGQNILNENGLGEHKCIRIGFHTGSSVRIIYEEVADFSDFRQIEGTNVWVICE